MLAEFEFPFLLLLIVADLADAALLHMSRFDFQERTYSLVTGGWAVNLWSMRSV